MGLAMIKNLTGQARFKLSGATLTVNFQPKEGITAVVGPNGSGKTFSTIESLRYLLFGSKALRTSLAAYSELEMSGTVLIHGRAYDVKRSLKAAQIEDAYDTILAVGQEEVTKKVVELLGYGLEVFDLCNASVQGETQSLGGLTPGKRKEKIDEVLRVSDVRATEKALRDEANNLSREADALSRSLPVVGERPVKPDGYLPSEELYARLEAARDLTRRRRALEDQIKPVALPDAPEKARPSDAGIEAAKHYSELKDRAANAPTAARSIEAIDSAERRYAWEQERDARGPKPQLDLLESQITAMIQTWDEIAAIEKMVDLDVECPECGHEFNNRPVPPADPVHSRTALVAEQARMEDWRDPLPFEPSNVCGSLSPRDAERERETRAKFDDADQASKELLKMTPTESVHTLRNREAAWAAYDQLTAKGQARLQDNAMIQRQLDDMDDRVDTDALADQLADSKLYEMQLDRFDADNDRFQELQRTINDKLQASENYLEGNRTLAEARAELKGFLAPTLSREATSLIYDMTNGELKGLIIDEDMNITVDGLPLEALSGAGKTVANIALRVSLTKVLTGSAFPVFLGDEMDGDQEPKRREATMQALVSLKKHLRQIILITHRDVDIADHVFDLGDTE